MRNKCLHVNHPGLPLRSHGVDPSKLLRHAHVHAQQPPVTAGSSPHLAPPTAIHGATTHGTATNRRRQAATRRGLTPPT